MWNMKENYFRKDNCQFPFLFQSVPLVFMGIAVARHAHSVCTAVGHATTSPAYVTACLASQEPSAMKVRRSFEETPGDEQAQCGLSSGSPGTCLQLLVLDASSRLCLQLLQIRLWALKELFCHSSKTSLFSEQCYTSALIAKSLPWKNQSEEGFCLLARKVMKSDF